MPSARGSSQEEYSAEKKKERKKGRRKEGETVGRFVRLIESADKDRLT